MAIAEACGWMKVHLYEDNQGPPILSGIPPISEADALSMSPERFRDWKLYGKHVPDYLNSLDAMHEVVKSQPEIVIKGMRFYLWEMCGQMKAHDATAAQRAEAFLKTIGKWVD